MRRILYSIVPLLFIAAVMSYSLTITSCQNPVSQPDTTHTNPTGTSIQGKVFDVNGFPFRGVKVYASPTNYTTTLSDGFFSLGNISYPVSLMLLKDGDSTLNVYQNLNANNPNLTYNTYSANTNFKEGGFILRYPTVQPGKGMLIQFASEDIINFNYSYAIADSDSVAIPITWEGDKQTILGKLILMTYRRDAFSPFLISSYDSYAEKEFYIDTNRIINYTFQGTDFTTNPDEAVINVRNFSYSSSSDNRAYFSLSGNTNSEMFLENYNFRGSFNFIVPKIFSSNRMRITTNSQYSNDSYVATNNYLLENSIITINGIPEIGLITPANNAVDVDSTATFLVNGNTSAQGVYIYQFQPDNNLFYTVWLYNSTPQFKYPDLSGYGFNLKRGANYKWTVQKLSPFYSLDDYVAYPTNKLIRSFDTQVNASYFTTLP